MNRNEDHLEPLSQEHHPALLCPGKLRKQLSMAGIRVAGELKNTLVDRRGGHGVRYTAEDHLGTAANITISRLATSDRRPTGFGLLGGEPRERANRIRALHPSDVLTGLPLDEPWITAAPFADPLKQL
jgi:hypothetical protein